jgi:biotin carboxyl carrier protein
LSEQEANVEPRAIQGQATLQVELRRLFQLAPPHVALRQALGRIGEFFEGKYLALHGCIGGEPFSEEWQQAELSVGDALREHVNDSMFGTLAGGVARAQRLGGAGAGVGGAAVLVAPMFDEELLAAGAAAMVVADTDREEVLATLGRFESIVGFLALLASTESDLATRVAAATRAGRRAVDKSIATAASASGSDEEDPWRVGWELVADLQNRYGVDQVALGLVRPESAGVEVRVLSGQDQVRAGNPGVRAIRAALEEGLDRAEPTLWAGREHRVIDDPDECPDDPRLHRQWSDSSGGDPVATVPMRDGGRIVGMIGLRSTSVDRIRRARLLAIEAELEAWAPLLPLVERAGRPLGEQLARAMRRRWRQSVGTGLRQRLTAFAAVAAVVAALFVVRVDDVVTAPATLVPWSLRTVSAPRTATLASVAVREGDRVKRGDLLARLDLGDTRLALEEARARLDVATAEVEAARAREDLATQRLAEARVDALAAEIAILAAELADADVRAPISGIVVQADLDHRVGDRVAIGERLFELVENERVEVEMRVPDDSVPDAEMIADAAASFSPFAKPDLRVGLGACVVSPAAEIVDRAPVFRVRAEAALDDATGLRPGMEGVARLTWGKMSLWTAATRPAMRWLRRRLWW